MILQKKSHIRAARIVGIGYIVMFFAAIFSNFIVRSEIILPGDIQATVSNLLISHNITLFRAAIISDLLFVLPLDIVLAYGCYVIFSSINNNVSCLAAIMRVVYTIIYGVSLVSHVIVVYVVEHQNGFENSLGTYINLLLQFFTYGWLTGFIFFGIHLLLLGYLALNSRSLPRFIGIGLILASICYIADSCLHILLHNYLTYKPVLTIIFGVPQFFGELFLFAWLFIKGITRSKAEML